MESVKIKAGEKTADGFELALNKATLVMARGKKGYIMCGYLNIAAAEQKKDAACVVKGVNTVDDLLAAKIVAVTPEAAALGVEPGMTGAKALGKLA